MRALCTIGLGIGMSFDDSFNDYESISGKSVSTNAPSINVLYAGVADAAIVTAIQTELTRIGSKLTPQNILDRATTQTCAGCHEASNSANLGPAANPLVWPDSGIGGFVQIDENGALSSALTTHFLPYRQRVLDDFINTHATDVPASASANLGNAKLTIDGKPLGAPN